MINRIYVLGLVSILGIFNLSVLSGAASAEGAINASIYKSGNLLIEEPAADDTSHQPATKTDSDDSKSSGNHRGDSIDDGHEGG